MRIDVEGLKQRVDLAAVVERYAGAPARRQGRWTWWRCPFHQEKSASFGVTSDDGRFKCFGCGVQGDVFEFVRLAEGLGDGPKDFVTAAEKVAGLAGVDGRRYTVDGGGKRRVPDYDPAQADGPPSKEWQEAAGWLVGEARSWLWKREGAACLRYLMSVRGLVEETVRAWGLGWWGFTSYEKARRWGLDRAQDVWLPKGLVIPGRVGDVLWYVKFRVAKDVGASMKYYGIPGGKTGLLGADRWTAGLPLVVCEGELDALTVWQEAREVVNVATLGGAAKGLGRWLASVAGFARVFTVFDQDQAGDKARAAWAGLGERVVALEVPFGGDVNGFYVQGGDVRAWVGGVLDCDPAQAVDGRRQTVDGGVDGRRQTVDGEEAAGWPKVLVFPADVVGLAVPEGRWQRLEDGRIEARFDCVEELAWTVGVAEAIRAS